MPINDTTTNRAYQKPNAANALSDDVTRLRSALDAIDTDMVSKAPTASPTFTGVVTVPAGSAEAPSLTFTGDINTGLYSPGADQVAIATGGTDRVHVGASGSIGFGTSSASNTAGFLRQVEIAGSLPALTLNQTDNSYTLRKYTIGVGSAGSIGLWDNNNSAYRLFVTDAGAWIFGGGTTPTSNGGVLQVSNGITFPGTQSACSDPNTLDDYEEGTFTPTIVGTGTAGTGTYSVQVGRYTKIGHRVYFQINLTWSAHTGTTNMIVGALPFTSANVTNAISAVSVRHSDLTSPASSVVQGFVAANATTITLESVAVAGGAAAALALDTAATLTVSGHYETP